RRSSKLTLTSSRSSRIGYVAHRAKDRSQATGCLWLVGPDVKPGHGLTRVLSFASPSGWRDQMTFCMRRREFIMLLGGAVVACPLAASAQQPAVPVVSFVSGRSIESSARFGAAFRKALNETG